MRIYLLKLITKGVKPEPEADIICSSFSDDSEALVATQRLFGHFIDDEAELHCIAEVDSDLNIKLIHKGKTLVTRFFRNKEVKE